MVVQHIIGRVAEFAKGAPINVINTEALKS